MLSIQPLDGAEGQVFLLRNTTVECRSVFDFFEGFEKILVLNCVPLNYGCQLILGYRWPRALGGNQAVQSSNIVWRTSRRLG